jgi:cytoskeletal protein RodZ
VSIGDTLADARQQTGLTISQVSQQTRIRESIIRAIEQGDFSQCGGDFYARGHIRSIASAVGADPVPLIREYDEEHGPPTAMRAAQVFEPATPIKIREPRRFGPGKAAAVLLLALIGFGIYHLVSTSGGSHKNTASDTATQRPVVTPSPTARPTIKPQVVTAPKPPEAIIRLTAVQNCWVGLTTSTGKQLYQGIIVAGSTRTWREKHPVNLVIGNPMGIVLTVNGKPAHTHSVNVLTLTINPASHTPVAIG